MVQSFPKLCMLDSDKNNVLIVGLTATNSNLEHYCKILNK